MIGITLALILAAEPTRADAVGALNALQAAVTEARAGARTFAVNAAKTRLCIDPPAGGIPAGSKVIRFGVVLLTPAAQRYLGFALPPGAATWDQVSDEYAAIEVQAPPSTVPTFSAALLANVDVIENEVEVRASAAFPACEIVAIRRDDSGIGAALRCACSTGSNCTVGGSAAPLGRTLDPGTFSGAGCKAKPCVERAGTSSWVAGCP